MPLETDESDHLIALLARNAERHGGDIALMERDRGIWQEWTWSAYCDHVLSLAAGFEAAGVKAGDIVLVIGDNRRALYAAMLALIALRAIPSPAYSDVNADELSGQVAREGIKIAVAEDQEQVDKLMQVRQANPAMTLIAYDDPRGLKGNEPAGVVALATLVEQGARRLGEEPGLRAALVARPQAGDIAVLLHSSGTTGVPKGVPLRHSHVLSGVRNAANAGYFG